MKTRTSPLPGLLGVVSGLLASYLLAQGAPKKEAAVDGIPTSPGQQSRSDGPAESSTEDFSSDSGTKKEKRRFLFTKDKLAKLRDSRRSLLINLNCFRTQSAADTDSTFELLRELLDLAPDEERNLRNLFATCATELVNYEKEHSKLTTDTDQKLVLELPSLGDKGEAWTKRIRQGTEEILGDERAAMLDAISHPDGIVRSRPNVASPLQLEFTQSGTMPGSIEWIKVTGGNIEKLMGVGGIDPEHAPVETMRDLVFEGFEHLIDEHTRTTFIQQAVRKE